MSEFLTFLIIGVVSASIYAVTAMGRVVTNNSTGVSRTENLTVVVVEQFAEAALALATQAVIMVNGRIAHAGPPDEVQALLVESYLGGG